MFYRLNVTGGFCILEKVNLVSIRSSASVLFPNLAKTEDVGLSTPVIRILLSARNCGCDIRSNMPFGDCSDCTVNLIFYNHKIVVLNSYVLT